MKKNYILLLCLLLGSLADTLGQTLTFAGTGTTSSYLYGPMYMFSASPRYLRSAHHFPEAQITLGSMPNGATITAIEFERASSTNAVVGNSPFFRKKIISRANGSVPRQLLLLNLPRLNERPF